MATSGYGDVVVVVVVALVLGGDLQQGECSTTAAGLSRTGFSQGQASAE